MEISAIHLAAAREAKAAFAAQKRFPALLLPDALDVRSYAALRKKVRSLTYVTKNEPLLHRQACASVTGLPTPALAAYVSQVCGKKIRRITFTAYRLSHRNYTIRSDLAREKPGLDVIIDLIDDWDAAHGGIVTYADGSGEYYAVPPRGNMLTIVRRKRGMERFISYVNNHAGKKCRYLLVGHAEIY